MRRRIFKVFRWIGLILLILAIVSLSGGYFYARQSLPLLDGTLKVSGITAPIEIRRDSDAVPHILAQSRQDALFGLGYVHAQDRLWQMDFQRRTAQGRLSETLRGATTRADRFMRTFGLHRTAQQSWEALAAEPKADINAYVAGVNAYISTHTGAKLPPEFTLLGVTPEPWTGADVLLFAKLTAFINGGSGVEDELFRAELIQMFGPERAQQLVPDPLDEMPILTVTGQPRNPVQKSWAESLAGVSVPDTSSSSTGYTELAELDTHLRTTIGVPIIGDRGIGSNSWVVTGDKSATGKPILANDPHLEAAQPSNWYLAHITGGDLNVIGATFPGLPVVLIGRNDSIAWGVTTSHADVADFFRERLDPTGTMAEYQGQMEPITVITETIKVKGQADLVIPIRITRHGPLLSDAISANRAADPTSDRHPLEPMSLRWTGMAIDDTTVTAYLQINRTKNWQEFVAALRQFVGPTQNFIYGDTSGNIGYYTAGRIPIRRSDNPSIPVEGWSDSYEWTGYVPFDELPHLYNPPEQFIMTANQRPTDLSYPYHLGRNWAATYRAERLAELLQAKQQLSVDDFAAMQSDTISLLAQQLVPSLVSLATPQNEQERQAIEILRSWDYDSRGDSVAAPILAAMLKRLPTALVDDELGPRLRFRYSGGVEIYVGRFMIATMRDRNSPWCDNIKTEVREDCSAVTNEVLRAGLQELQAKMGDDMSTWRWDRVHFAVFPHQPLRTVPILGWLTNRQISTEGDWGTVNVGNYTLTDTFEQYLMPSYRQIVDLSSTTNGQFIQTTGQSGNVMSPHYDDYMQDWRDVHYRTMRFDRQSVEAARSSVLRLEPIADRLLTIWSGR